MRQIVLLLLAVAAAQASVSVTRSAGNDMHPSAMEIEVQLPDTNKKVRIPLTKVDAFENIPVTVTENGRSRTFSSHQIHHASHAHYRDVQTKSVISVRHVNGKRRISGHVTHEGMSYFLEPVGEADHAVKKNELSPEAMIAKQVSKDIIQSRRRRQTNAAATTYKVELYLLLDSRVWSYFQALYGSETDTLTELHLYYTHILNGIDTVYRNIGTPSISVSCIGMTISKTLADDTWMAGEDTEGGNILKAMTSYIVGKPAADHYMAFTRMDISGSGSFSVCGMAYVGKACTGSKVSINEDQGLHSWGTAAHELGHNLGSNHDSDGNTCDKANQFIMSPVGGIYTISDVANSYRFSTCSVNYIAQYISSLGSSSCLTTDQGTKLTDLTSSTREGVHLTLDKVCQLVDNTSPGYYKSPDLRANPALMCASIACLTEGSTATSFSYVTKSGVRAPVGTPCGSQKSCNWNGQCTADSTAPVVDESCFFGDSWSNCDTWKTYIQNKRTSCTTSAKANCCKSLATLCP